MSKKSVIARQKKREVIVAKYAARRAELKAKVVNLDLSFDERMDAQLALQKLPKNSSKVRLVNRCQLTGRPKGVLRKFKMSRNMLRIYAMMGDIPGLVKSSW